MAEASQPSFTLFSVLVEPLPLPAPVASSQIANVGLIMSLIILIPAFFFFPEGSTKELQAAGSHLFGRWSLGFFSAWNSLWQCMKYISIDIGHSVHSYEISSCLMIFPSFLSGKLYFGAHCSNTQEFRTWISTPSSWKNLGVTAELFSSLHSEQHCYPPGNTSLHPALFWLNVQSRLLWILMSLSVFSTFPCFP